MTYRHQSEVPKKGEPIPHWLARCRIKGILEKLGYTVTCLPEEEQSKKTQLRVDFDPLNFHYKKAFDIFAVKFFPKTGLETNLIVEVDGLKTRHEKAFQKKKDRFAEKVAEAIIYNLEFVRIDQDFVLDEDTTDEDILKALHLDFYNKYSQVL